MKTLDAFDEELFLRFVVGDLAGLDVEHWGHDAVPPASSLSTSEDTRERLER